MINTITFFKFNIIKFNILRPFCFTSWSLYLHEYQYRKIWPFENGNWWKS